jgi:hypothetical protein
VKANDLAFWTGCDPIPSINRLERTGHIEHVGPGEPHQHWRAVDVMVSACAMAAGSTISTDRRCRRIGQCRVMNARSIVIIDDAGLSASLVDHQRDAERLSACATTTARPSVAEPIC